MARLRLAREIAEKTGRSLSDATRFIRQVGDDTARSAVRAADSRTSWKLPATLTVGTGGVLLWREQNIREAEAIADRSQNTLDALGRIMDSDLPPEIKASLADSLATDGLPTGGGGSKDDESGDGPFGDLFESDLQQTIIMIVVLLVVLGFAVNYASNIGKSAATTGGEM